MQTSLLPFRNSEVSMDVGNRRISPTTRLYLLNLRRLFPTLNLTKVTFTCSDSSHICHRTKGSPRASDIRYGANRIQTGWEALQIKAIGKTVRGLGRRAPFPQRRGGGGTLNWKETSARRE